jgi:hypothetical protein
MGPVHILNRQNDFHSFTEDDQSGVVPAVPLLNSSYKSRNRRRRLWKSLTRKESIKEADILWFCEGWMWWDWYAVEF